MRALFAGALLFVQISTVYAQTPPAAETTATETPVQQVEACHEIPSPPDAVDVSRMTPLQMSVASDRQAAWRAQAAQVIECRRLYYNAAIARFNEVNHAWSEQLDAFCARRNIHCTPREATPTETPAQ